MAKHYLIITHAFPPTGGGGVQRIVKFAKYLKAEGWIPTVICSEQTSSSWQDMKRLEEVADIHVVRVPLKAFGNTFFDKVKRKFKYIDPFVDWSNAVIKHLETMDLGGQKLVFTSGPPHSVHKVGLYLKKRKGIRWVADFRDHFTLGPEYNSISPLHAWLNRRFEQKIYNRANAIVTNTDTNRVDVLREFSVGDGRKIHTIYNGYDYDDLAASIEVENSWNTEKLNFLYLGGLRGDHIDGIFYKILQRALEIDVTLSKKVTIHVLGDISRKGAMVEELELESMFVFKSYVAYNEVGAYLCMADAGITWQRDKAAYGGTIAGKIFDYIGAKLPIFSIGQSNGEIEKIINKYQIGISTPSGDTEKAANDFITFCEQLVAKKYDYTKEKVDLLDNRFNRKRQAVHLYEIFESLESN